MPRLPDSEQEKPKKLQGTERRSWVRYPRRLTVTWQLFGARGNEQSAATVHDLSLSGIGLVLNRSFPPATVLTLRLGRHGPERTMLARVRHNSAQPNGEWLVGCTFAVKLREDDLEALVG
jgi:hypothetical protein